MFGLGVLSSFVIINHLKASGLMEVKIRCFKLTRYSNNNNIWILFLIIVNKSVIKLKILVVRGAKGDN